MMALMVSTVVYCGVGAEGAVGAGAGAGAGVGVGTEALIEAVVMDVALIEAPSVLLGCPMARMQQTLAK